MHLPRLTLLRRLFPDPATTPGTYWHDKAELDADRQAELARQEDDADRYLWRPTVIHVDGSDTRGAEELAWSLREERS